MIYPSRRFILSVLFAAAAYTATRWITPWRQQTSFKAPEPAFDRQYIQPNASNDAGEWWWFQAIAEPGASGIPPAFQVLFYQGYAFQFGPRDPALPEYYLDIKGFHANGSAYSLTLPAPSGAVSTAGQEVHGVWPGAGAFHVAPDYTTVTLTFDAPGQLEGTVVLRPNNARHFACNSTETPYFAPGLTGADGAQLSAAEDVLWNQLGWAVTAPGGAADVDLRIGGTPLKFAGRGYHDQNWTPQPLNRFVSTWYFGSGEAGPYTFSYASAAPLDSPRALSTGYLARDGVVLQNQCSVAGARAVDRSEATPWGAVVDDSGLVVPRGYVVEYVLGDGERYVFNLTGRAENPAKSVYHRWVGMAVGGKAGERYEGLAVFEWLNPGLVPYVPSERLG